MDTKNRDDFAKVSFGYRTVFVTVLLFVCAVLLGLCCKILSDNIVRTNQNFEYYYQRVENKLDGFAKASEALFASSDVKRVCEDLTDTYDVNSTIPVRKLIDDYEDFFTNGEGSIILTNLEDEISLSSKGTMRIDDVCKELILDEDAIKTIKNNHQSDRFYVYSKNSGLIRFVFRHRYNNINDDIYCFITTDATVFVPDENFVIADGRARYQEKLGNTGFVNVGKTYVRESVIVPGLTYKYAAKYDNVLLLVFIVICMLVCIAGIFCSKRLTEKVLNITYMPLIAATRQNEEDDPAKTADTWDESAKKLISDSEQMRNNLKENRVYRKKSFLRNLLYDIEDYQIKYLEEHALAYLDAECRVVLMDFTYKGDYTNMRERMSDDEFACELENRISRIIPGEFVPVSDGRYVYITNVCDKDELRKNLAGVLEFAASCKMDALVAVGDKIEGLKNVKSSFRNALDCLERRSAFPPHFIVFSSELGGEHSSFYYPIDVEVRLIENIMVGNREAVDEILGMVLAKNLYEISLNTEKLRELKIVMVGTINRAINRMNKDASDIFGENTSVYLEIGASRNKEEFAKSVRSVFGMLCSYNRNTGGEPKQDKIARDIMAYIESNYNDPHLSLEGVARIFFISQNHASRVLKNKIGKSYKEYVNDVRIKEAKHLLKNTPMTVVNVANNVGYTDIRAFNRLFKKYTNQTPNEYRVSDQD